MSEYVTISDRLRAITALVPADSVVCDVGCDHALVPIFLVETGTCRQAIAMDVRPGPLSAATENIARRGLSKRIETRLSDGLQKLQPGEADGFICAGMGGKLTVKIMEDSFSLVKQMNWMILQPQSEIQVVRRFLRTHGFFIEREDMVLEDGKFYPMMFVRNMAEDDCFAPQTYEDRKIGDEGFSPEDYYGPRLLEMKHPVLREYLEKRRDTAEKVRRSAAHHPNRVKETDEELARIEKALSFLVQ